MSPDDKLRRKAHARWVHDVLLVNTGVALALTTPYGVSALNQLEDDGEPVKGLGSSVSFLSVRIDGGDEAVVAVPGEYVDVAMGPFH